MRTPVTRIGRRRAGFTLMELMIVVAIIGLLATLAFVVLSRSIRDARASLERQSIVAVKNSVESFKQQFGFLPPLIDDTNPLDVATNNPRIRSDGFLRSETNPNDPRYSIRSIPFYLMGVLGADQDGVEGPGFTEPQRDGSFSRRGRDFAPLLDVSRDPARLKHRAGTQTEWAYVDRWGKAGTSTAGWPPINPIRYYRWAPAFKPDGKLDQYLVPRAVGDPNKDMSLRDATYAIVSVGPNGVTDERRPLPLVTPPTPPQSDGRTGAIPIDPVSTGDDIVEVGR